MTRPWTSNGFLRIVGRFTFMGPLVGTALVWLFLFGPFIVPRLIQSGNDGPLLDVAAAAVGGVLLSIPVGYAVGGPLAFVTGVVCSVFARLKSDWLWFGVCSALGFAITFAGCSLFSLGLETASQMGAIGAAAAAACAFLLRRSRWSN